MLTNSHDRMNNSNRYKNWTLFWGWASCWAPLACHDMEHANLIQKRNLKKDENKSKNTHFSKHWRTWKTRTWKRTTPDHQVGSRWICKVHSKANLELPQRRVRKFQHYNKGLSKVCWTLLFPSLWRITAGRRRKYTVPQKFCPSV